MAIKKRRRNSTFTFAENDLQNSTKVTRNMFGKVIDKVIFIDSEIWYIHKLKISDKKKRLLLTTTESQVVENKGDE